MPREPEEGPLKVAASQAHERRALPPYNGAECGVALPPPPRPERRTARSPVGVALPALSHQRHLEAECSDEGKELPELLGLQSILKLCQVCAIHPRLSGELSLRQTRL